MKKTARLLFIAFTVAAIGILLCLTASASGGIESFGIKTYGSADSSLGTVKWFKNGNNGKYYMFIPNECDTENLEISFIADGKVTCGGRELVNGEKTDVFSSCGEYSIVCGENTYSLVVMKGSGIGSVYINTESGSLSSVHADKEYKEPGTILIVSDNGGVQYNGKLEYIKGRGNSTWNLEKKPYNIKLDEKTDLFGMGKSKKWCLLANASDATMIRNELAYGLSRDIGVDTTSDTVQLNMYINGCYEGVYMLTEKVEVGKNRVDIFDLEGATEDINGKDLDSFALKGSQNSRDWNKIKYADIPKNPENITGGYLLELEKIYRYVNEPSGFITKIGQPVVVKSPEYASKAQVEYINSYYQEFENALYSPTGYNSSGKHYSDYIDIESLARMYVMNEFGANFDGCSSSFYLYKDIGGKLVAGPLWDYDLSFGTAMQNELINHVPNVADPNLLYIQTCFIGNHNESKNSLLAQAFFHSDFRDAVRKIWNGDIKGLIDAFKDNIDLYSGYLSMSAAMNAVRWNIFGTADSGAINANYMNHVNVIRNYVDARYAFLSNAYSPDTYFVTYDGGKYAAKLVRDNVLYKSGDTAVVAEAPAASDKNAVFLGWSETPDGDGTLYKAGDEITVNGDTALYAQWANTNKIQSFLRRIYSLLISFFQKIADLFFN